VKQQVKTVFQNLKLHGNDIKAFTSILIKTRIKGRGLNN
jgi:uncharacterized protein (UPF0335 family)